MELKTFIDVETFLEEVQGEISDLALAMSTQTARTAYYGIQYTKAQKQANIVKLTFASIEAKLTSQYREQLEQAAREEVDGTNKSPTRITAEMVKSAVHLDANYLKWARVKIDADEIESVCRIALDAFKTRRDMLNSLGHLTSAKLRGDATIAGAIDAGNRHRSRLAERDARRQQQPADQASSA